MTEPEVHKTPSFCPVHSEVIACENCSWWYDNACQWTPENEAEVETLGIEEDRP